MKERIYQIVVVVLAVMFLVSINNYNDLLEVNKQFISVIDEQRNSYNSQYILWEHYCDDLQSDYGALLSENESLKSAMDKADIPIYDFTEAEVYLLAQCVEAEAGFYKDYEISQQYITQVILNRLHSSKFPNYIEEVIYQKVNGVPQFSVAYDGSMDDREVKPETLANVYSVIVHGSDLPDYVCYFYSESVTENWVNTLNVYDTVGETVFAYEDKEDY